MPYAVRTDLVVRLHVDKHGVVWYGDDGDLADNTCLDPWDFFENDTYLQELDNARVIRLLGTRANAPLIVKLQERRASNSEFRKKTIMLGSPAALPACWVRDDPAAVLLHIWQPPIGANLAGHWHEMTQSDYSTYAMINTIGDRDNMPEVPQVTKKIAEYHPAWPAITFVKTVNEDAACQLLCHIVDPRWYRHGTHPERRTRLHSHLGLTPENMAAIVGDTNRHGLHFNRATLAVRTWYNRPGCRAEEPGDFLFKILRSHVSLARGLLRSTQRFVDLVSAIWLDAVLQSRHPEVSFNPDKFFRDAATSRAFSRHHSEYKRV